MLSTSGEAALKGRLQQLRLLKGFLSSLPDKMQPMERLSADYLSWSGLTTSGCLELLACSYASNSSLAHLDRDLKDTKIKDMGHKDKVRDKEVKEEHGVDWKSKSAK